MTIAKDKHGLIIEVGDKVAIAKMVTKFTCTIDIVKVTNITDKGSITGLNNKGETIRNLKEESRVLFERRRSVSVETDGFTEKVFWDDLWEVLPKHTGKIKVSVEVIPNEYEQRFHTD